MPSDDVSIRVRILNAREAAAEAKRVESSVGGIGKTAKREMEGATLATGKFHGGLGKLGLMLTGAGFAGFALTDSLKTIAEAGREAMLTTRQTEAVLKSTGAEAWTDAKHIEGLSTRLSLMSGVDAELITKGQNLLLTFQHIRNEAGKGNDIFDRTTRTALNMSAAFESAGKHMTVTQAMLQLGKALNDPAKGMSRLTRMGVVFTQQQTDMVKHLQATGHTMQAQKLILGALDQKFAGSAKAQADPLKRINAAWKAIERTLGTALMPTFVKVGDVVAKFVGQIVQGRGAGGRFAQTMKQIGREVAAVAKFLWEHRRAVAAVIGGYVALRAALRIGGLLSAARSGFLKLAGAEAAAAGAGGAGGAAGLLSKLRGLGGLLSRFGPAAGVVGIAALGFSHLGDTAHFSADKASELKAQLLKIGPAGDRARAAAAAMIPKMQALARGNSWAAQGAKEWLATLHSIGVNGPNDLSKLKTAWDGLNQFIQANPINATVGIGGLQPSHVPGTAHPLPKATGGVIGPGEVTLVGERGPELLTGPAFAGSTVHTHSETERILAGGGQDGGVRDIVVRSPIYLDGRVITEAVVRHTRDQIARR